MYEFADPIESDDFIFMTAFYAVPTDDEYSDGTYLFDDLDDWLLNKAGGDGDNNPQDALSTNLDGVFDYVKTNIIFEKNKFIYKKLVVSSYCYL